MNHADTLRNAASKGDPYLTCVAGTTDLMEAADYIELLEREVARLLTDNQRLVREAKERVENFQKRLNAVTEHTRFYTTEMMELADTSSIWLIGEKALAGLDDANLRRE